MRQVKDPVPSQRVLGFVAVATDSFVVGEVLVAAADG